MDRRVSHKALYKSPRGRTPPWKEMYRKRCFERLQESRASLVEKFRFCGGKKEMENIVEDFMEVEWNTFSKNQRFPSLSLTSNNNVLDTSFNSIGEFDEEATREMLLEIQNELTNEGEMVMNDVFKFDTDELNNKVASMNTDEVLCPICQIRNLKEGQISSDSNGSVLQITPTKFLPMSPVLQELKCDCGFNIQRNQLSLTMIRTALQHTMDNHNQSCSDRLAFSTTSDCKGSNVLITCASCDWMSFLL